MLLYSFIKENIYKVYQLLTLISMTLIFFSPNHKLECPLPSLIEYPPFEFMNEYISVISVFNNLY